MTLVVTLLNELLEIIILFNSIHTSERFAYLRIKFECKDKKKELNHQHISEYFAYIRISFEMLDNQFEKCIFFMGK